MGAHHAGPGVEVAGDGWLQGGQQQVHSTGEGLEGTGQDERRGVVLQEGHVGGQCLQQEGLPMARPAGGELRLTGIWAVEAELLSVLPNQTPVQLRATL